MIKPQEAANTRRLYSGSPAFPDDPYAASDLFLADQEVTEAVIVMEDCCRRIAVGALMKIGLDGAESC